MQILIGAGSIGKNRLGPSHMSAYDHYLLIAYYDENYRPSLDGSIRWINVYNDAVSDGNAAPTHWAYPPIFPED